MPTIFQVINVAVTKNALAISTPYAAASYILYGIQVTLTIVALRTVVRKKAQNAATLQVIVWDSRVSKGEC